MNKFYKLKSRYHIHDSPSFLPRIRQSFDVKQIGRALPYTRRGLDWKIPRMDVYLTSFTMSFMLRFDEFERGEFRDPYM